MFNIFISTILLLSPVSIESKKLLEISKTSSVFLLGIKRHLLIFPNHRRKIIATNKMELEHGRSF